MAATLINVAATAFIAGTPQTFSGVSPTALGAPGYQYVFTNAADWPTSGDVFTLDEQLSADNTNWTSFGGVEKVAGGPWKNNTAVGNVFNPRPVRFIRLVITPLQNFTLSIVLKTL